MNLDELYYSDPQVQKNISIRAKMPDMKVTRETQEREAKMFWLLNKGIAKGEIEKHYGKFNTYK